MRKTAPKTPLLALVALSCALLPAPGWATEAAAPSEQDFLAEMPIVLSVSRLAQPLNEAPGAVTVLDRDTIRRSGARNVSDLMRLVPGFQVSDSFEFAPTIVAYHGGLGDYANRMQVLIDGRSAYSAFMFGNVTNGLLTIAVEDIDHIEVLRGSNSATYGARAVLGVINIVTRDPADTTGVLLSNTSGNNGISDRLLRGGWGNDDAKLRISVSRSGDSGLVGPLGHYYQSTVSDALSGPNGANHITLANLRADLRAGQADTVELRAGMGDQTSGTGNAIIKNPGNPLRQRRYQSRYLQGDWKHILGPDADVALSYSHSEETFTENFPYKPIPSLIIDFGGDANNDALLLQHALRLSPDMRLVYGSELRREEVRSQQLYGVPSRVTDFFRLFGNLEWHLLPALVFNAGALEEHSSLSGNDFAPRLTLNWHVLPEHTLRVGASQAYRPPSMYEKEASTKYYVNNVLAGANFVATGAAQPEKVRSSEIGYLGEIRPLNASVDLRVFREAIDNAIISRPYTLAGTKLAVMDFGNDSNPIRIHGAEYQLKLRPWRDTQLTYNQSFIHINAVDVASTLSAPGNSRLLMASQLLPGNLELSLMHYTLGAMTWQKPNNMLSPWDRTDLRLAWKFKMGGRHGEVATTVQNLGGRPYNDYNNHFFFPRQIFTTVSLQL